MSHWSSDSVFYHIYPLGFCGAPANNDFQSAPMNRLEKVYGWLDHLQWLGVNALYLGPLFESSVHGYDTADYYHVDRRLGDRATLARLSQELHRRGMRLILDGVFNHVGRDFWAFRDLRQNGEQSPYRDWFEGVNFQTRSPLGDPFTYNTWAGHYDLVKLNLHNPAVRDHLLQAVKMWVDEFGIDGLRLDVADCLDIDFQQELARFCRQLRPDFWLMGEVIHGDYRGWANPQTLDSVTNYEVYKSLYSSHVDRNYFEIAYALNRQFGEGGIYRGLPLYAFADNHDVDRVASRLTEPAHLYPLYILLFTLPGVPSIYYGSEWGITGQRTPTDDRALRPALDLHQTAAQSPNRDLAPVIARLAQIRRASPALMYGDYRQLHIASEQFAYLRQGEGQSVIVAVNAAKQPAKLAIPLPMSDGKQFYDVLNASDPVTVQEGMLLVEVPPCWGRIFLTK